jgi:heat shock protein HslJ
LANWQWQSTQASDGASIVAADPSRYTIEFRADGNLQIRADCNRVLGSYTVTGSSISIQLGPSTLVGCPPDSQADAFLAGLIQAATFAVSGGNLELGLALGGRMLFSEVPEPQLIGPEWQLLSYNNGREAVVSILDGTQPTATFGSAGSVSGSAGCNTYNGPFQTTSNSISMGPFATTRMACPPPVMEQETAFLRALERASTFEFVDGRLEFRDSNGATQAVFQQ